MDASLAITPLKFNEASIKAASRASSSTADVSLAISHGDVQGKLMGRKSEASTLHKRKRQNPTPCPKQAPVEGGSSSFDEARAVNTKPQRFITVELPDDLPTDEEIRQQAPDERIALCLQMKRNAELLLRLNLQTMNALKIELQKNGHRNSEALAAIDGMISKFEEILAAARALPSFNIGTRNSSDKEIPGEGPPVNEVKTVARYDTRKLKMGKQVSETSVVVAKKNTSSRN